MYLIVDTYSVLGQILHLRDEEFGIDVTFEGTKFHIPSLETCVERAEEMFQAVIDKLSINPQKIIMVCDQDGTGAARKRIYPEYKAGRQSRPKQYYEVFNSLVSEICEFVMKSGGVKATPRVTPAVEGDDLVYELCKRLPETTVWSTDKDFFAFPATHHYIGGTLDDCKFPVPQDLIITYRAIVTGDASDNIPSAKGFGPRAWEELLELVGPEGLYELKKMIEERRLHELSEDVPSFPKLQKIIDSADNVYLAYQLMSPIHVPAHKVKFEARCQETTQELVTKHNFDQVYELISNLKFDHSVIDFETDVPPESHEWIEQTKNEDGKGGVGVDVIASEITGMGLKIDDKAWYFSVDHKDTDNITLENLESIIKLIKDKRCYAHNTQFENTLIYNTYGYFLEDVLDTMLMASYVNENDYMGLKHLSKRDLGYDQTSYDTVVNGRSGMREVTGEEVLSYGIDDVITCDALQNLYTVILQYEDVYDVFLDVEQHSLYLTTLAFVKGVRFDQEVYDRLKSENDANLLKAEAELEKMLVDVEFGEDVVYHPLPKMVVKSSIAKLFEAVTGDKFVCAARTVKGCIEWLNTNGYMEIAAAVDLGHDEMNVLYKEHWRPRANLNVRSPKQVKELIYGTLQCPVRIRNPMTDNMRKKGLKEGNPSTDDEAISNAIAFGDVDEKGKMILEKLLEYKGYLTRESLFLSKFPKYIHWKTGRMHPTMKQCGTTTRRFTHSAYNGSQLPKKKGKEVRDLLLADEGYSFVSLDFSSQELKLQAEDCGCEKFQACYLGDTPVDVHTATGYEVAKMQGVDVGTLSDFIVKVKSGDKDAKQFRADGKATNFAASYGASSSRLSHMLAIPDATAKLFLEAKNRAFPGLIPHVDKYHLICQKQKYATTFLGARRHLAKQYAMSRTDGELSKVNRLAWSFRIQGSAAEMVKLAMSRIWKSGLVDGKVCWMQSQIHDELNFMVRDDKLNEYVPKLVEMVTANYANMKIPMTTEPEVGKNFGSLKEFKGA